MNSILIYFTIVSILTGVTYLIYLIVFNSERNFKQRRYFLIITMLFSLLIPLTNFSIQLYLNSYRNQPEKIENSFFSSEQFQNSTNYQPKNVLAHQQKNIEKHIPNSLPTILSLIYLSVVFILLLRILFQIISITVVYSKSRLEKYSNHILVFNKKYNNTFSFFNWIFVNSNFENDNDLKKILAHEIIHVSQKHSYDALFFELLCAFVWFNPFVWLKRKSLKLVHEYLADEGALNTDINPLEYQTLVLNQIAETNLITISSQFDHSIIKKRLNMIINSHNYSRTRLKILVLIPVAIALIFIVACANGIDNEKVIVKNMSKNETITSTFTKKEIKDIAKLRLLVDNEVVNQTKESNVDKAYEIYIQQLSKNKNITDINSEIKISHNDILQIINNYDALNDIYKLDTLSDNSVSISLNLSGKGRQFIQTLSEENQHYKMITEGINVAGDISPALFADFFISPQNYHYNSEAEKLYASIIVTMLTNPIHYRQD